MINNCDKCKEQLGLSDSYGRITLYGGRALHLCSRCVSEWNRFLGDHPLWVEVMEGNAIARQQELDATSGKQVSLEDIRSLLKKRHELERKAFDLSGEWLPGK